MALFWYAKPSIGFYRNYYPLGLYFPYHKGIFQSKKHKWMAISTLYFVGELCQCIEFCNLAVELEQVDLRNGTLSNEH